MLVRECRLYQDVYLDHRDAMYRAMTFIARRGGSRLPGDAKEVLIAHRDRVDARPGGARRSFHSLQVPLGALETRLPGLAWPRDHSSELKEANSVDY